MWGFTCLKNHGIDHTYQNQREKMWWHPSLPSFQTEWTILCKSSWSSYYNVHVWYEIIPHKLSWHCSTCISTYCFKNWFNPNYILLCYMFQTKNRKNTIWYLYKIQKCNFFYNSKTDSKLKYYTTSPAKCKANCPY